jgi:mycofactocin precursor
MDNAPTTVTSSVPSTGPATGSSTGPDLETTAVTTAGDTDELLIEEISIDGMCGVY